MNHSFTQVDITLLVSAFGAGIWLLFVRLSRNTPSERIFQKIDSIVNKYLGGDILFPIVVLIIIVLTIFFG